MKKSRGLLVCTFLVLFPILDSFNNELLGQQASELEEIKYVAEVYLTLLYEFESIVPEFISNSNLKQKELFLNAIKVTADGIRVYKQGIVDGYGVTIPIEMLKLSEVDFGRFEGSTFNRKYIDALKQGLEGFGILQSKNLGTKQIPLLAKDFFPSWQVFPKDATLILLGFFRGFFISSEGDLIIPGKSFYYNLSNGDIDLKSFKSLPPK